MRMLSGRYAAGAIGAVLDAGSLNGILWYVSWEDAQAYVEWLSRETGKGYRLLSQAEWEYAARAGTTTPFHFGGTISTEEANDNGSYRGNYRYARRGKGVYRGKMVAVGSFAANAFGLYGVHGNVWE